MAAADLSVGGAPQMTADCAGHTRYRIGVDVGGTHTDLVLLDPASGSVRVEKVPSTPANPALGVLDGVRRFFDSGIDPASVAFFSHGTTITTNALLEMRGEAVGLLITRGYRAVQEVQGQARDGNLFDYFYAKPQPIAPQSLTHEIPGRLDHAGDELEPLDTEAVRRAARALRAAGVRSIAVCYLFSYANPAHERATRDAIVQEYPEAHVSLSSEVLPRIREWERLSTTLINAYLEPVLTRYIGHLGDALDDCGVTASQRFLMQSNGGVMPFAAAVAGGRTVHTLFSGPAAGAQASAYLSAHGVPGGIVTLDMGGTSADIAFIEGGTPLEATDSVIGRRQLNVPSLDMATIPAGGGSLAGIDGTGFLTVGPQSAGADPGPACYRRGGTRPTVTDADVLCGYLNPRNFLGGAQSLDVEAARRALQTGIGDRLGMDALEVALGIRRIVDMRMADEVRVFAARRGVDLGSFTLLPFGGAGAVHAAAVAEELGMKRIVVPGQPGAFSALGLLCTDVVHDYIRSDLTPLAMVMPDAAEAAFAALEEKAREDIAAEGLDPARAEFIRELDLRYTGQGYELRTPLEAGSGPLTAADLAAVRGAFDRLHAQIHGHAAADRPVEIVSYRTRLRVEVPKFVPRAEDPTGASRRHRATAHRRVHFDGTGAVKAGVFSRSDLGIGDSVAGPAIVEQLDSTIVVPPGWAATVDGFRNLTLERTGR